MFCTVQCRPALARTIKSPPKGLTLKTQVKSKREEQVIAKTNQSPPFFVHRPLTCDRGVHTGQVIAAALVYMARRET